MDGNGGELSSFLTKLSEDRQLQDAYARDPQGTMREAGLSDDTIETLLSRDLAKIKDLHRPELHVPGQSHGLDPGQSRRQQHDEHQRAQQHRDRRNSRKQSGQPGYRDRRGGYLDHRVRGRWQQGGDGRRHQPAADQHLDQRVQRRNDVLDDRHGQEQRRRERRCGPASTSAPRSTDIRASS